MGSQVGPFIQRDAVIPCSLNKKYFVFVTLKFKNHGYVVKIAVCESSCQKAGSRCTFEKQEITSISLFQELLLANIVEFPGLFDLLFYFTLSFTVLNMSFDFLNPLIAVLRGLGPEFKYPAWNNYIEPMSALFLHLTVHVIKIDNTLRHLCIFGFKVLHFAIIEHKIPLLPAFEPGGTFFP